MPEEQSLEQQMRECKSRFTRLSEQIGKLQKSRDEETRAEEKIRLDSLIEEKDAERRQAETELQELKSRCDSLQWQQRRASMESEAHRLERNKAFQNALEQWLQILDENPADSLAPGQIQRLKKRLEQAKLLDDLSQCITRRWAEVSPIAKDIVVRLRQMRESNEMDHMLLGIIASFLEGKITAHDFVDVWKACAAAPAERNGRDYRALADRIKRGEIVLFLGSDIPAQLDVGVPAPDTIAPALAAKAQYQGYAKSLPMIAEYYQMHPDYGRLHLIREFNGLIDQACAEISLYTLLAKIDQPLVLISTNYDQLLETCLQQQQKKYAVVSSIIDANAGYIIGTVIVRWSDKPDPQCLSLEQDLSSLDLLKNNYSIIYKIRGFCEQYPLDNPLQHSILTLAEENYFTFARHMDKLIPNYLITEINNRSLFFLGHKPRQWVDRLLVNAILDKRRQTMRPYVVTEEDDEFVRAYWEHRGVLPYNTSLKDFVRGMKEFMP
jgi:hypothetical protein